MTCTIPLTKGRVALVDDEDADLAQYAWHWHPIADRAGYATRFIGRQVVYLHRVILGRMEDRTLTRSELCDHINGNGLDNRRSNLRLATRSQNQHNRKCKPGRYKGVQRKYDRWVAYIGINGQRRRLGAFATPEEAAQAYNKASQELHGEFGVRNELEPTL